MPIKTYQDMCHTLTHRYNHAHSSYQIVLNNTLLYSLSKEGGHRMRRSYGEEESPALDSGSHNCRLLALPHLLFQHCHAVLHLLQ